VVVRAKDQSVDPAQLADIIRALLVAGAIQNLASGTDLPLGDPAPGPSPDTEDDLPDGNGRWPPAYDEPVPDEDDAAPDPLPTPPATPGAIPASQGSAGPTSAARTLAWIEEHWILIVVIIIVVLMVIAITHPEILAPLAPLAALFTLVPQAIAIALLGVAITGRLSAQGVAARDSLTLPRPSPHFFQVLPVAFTGPETGPAIGISSL
jgi:uncharacterized integral membrane protein